MEHGSSDYTKLNIFFDEDMPHVDFLPQLLQLKALELDCFNWNGGWFVPADALLASLLQCARLTELNLWCGLNSAHWSSLFAKLSIKKLSIRGAELETLQCFAEGPITLSLEELTLRDLELPQLELSHLYGLRRLRTLHLDKCISPRLDDATFESLSPPTAFLPTLTKLVHHRSHLPGDLFESQAASFEWMQQRMTQ